MPLTSQQLQALSAFEWLVSPHDSQRGTGRTFALAVASIRQACAHPGTPLRIMELEGRNILRDVIAGLISSDYRLSPRATLRRDWFRLDLPQPILGWLPSEAILGAWSARLMGTASAQRLAELFAEGVQEEEHPDYAQLLPLPTRALHDVEELFGITLSPEERAAAHLPEPEPTAPPRSRLERLLSDDD